MQFGKKKIRAALRELNEALKAAKMINSTHSAEIKEATRLYRDSWIVAPIERVITEMKKIIAPLETSE